MVRSCPRCALLLCALAVLLAGGRAPAAGGLRAVAPEAYAAYCMGVGEMQHGRFAKAITWFKKALEADPKSAACHVWLGTIYAQKLHDPRAGRKHFDTALELSPQNFRARHGIAKQHIRAGRYKEAAEQIRVAIKSPEAEANRALIATAYFDLATSAQLRGLNEQAAEYYAKAAEKSPNPVYILVRLAYLRRSMRQHTKAAEVFLEVKRLVPTYAKVHRELCDSYKAGGKWSEALDELLAYMRHRDGPGERTTLLKEAAALAEKAGRAGTARDIREKVLLRLVSRYTPDQATPKGCRDIGLALESAGRLKQAAPYLKRAAEGIGDPGAKLALRVYLASVYERLGRFEQAAAQLEECIKGAEPKVSVPFRARLSAVLESAGKHAEAENALKEILAVPGFEAAGHAELGFFHTRRGNTDKAAEQLRKAIKLGPPAQTARWRVHLSVLFSDAGRHKEAEQVLLEAKKLFPDNASVNNALGWYYAERGIKLDEALALVRKALKSQPANPYYLDSLGWIYFKQGRKVAALAELKKASGLSSEGIIWEHLGDVHMALGQPEKAKEHWLRSLEFDPKLKGVREKLDKLKPDR